MRRPGRHAGYSLLSVAVSLAILGLFATALLGYWESLGRTEQAQVDQALLRQAEQGLLSYTYTRHRLPCPDESGNGREDRDSVTGRCLNDAQKGSLPWRSIGLPDERARRVRYGVYRAPDSTAADRDLAAARDRFRPLASSSTSGGSAAASEALLSNANLLDFCFALSQSSEYARTTSADPDRLHIGAGADRNAVAFALATPGRRDASGDGVRFDGAQSSAAPRFDRPSRGKTFDNDDRVKAVGFDALFGYFGCGQALAAVGHTHFNAAGMAVILNQAFSDYEKVLKIQHLLSAAGIAAATGGVASSGAGVASAAADISLEVAQTVGTYGALSPTIALGVAALGLETTGLVLASAGLAAAIASEVILQQRLDQVSDLITEASTLESVIGSNAKEADRNGLSVIR